MLFPRLFPLFLLSILLLPAARARAADPLRACWQQQAQPLQTRSLSLRYHETLAQLEHSFQPWQATNYTGSGRIWSRADAFSKADTLQQGAKIYFSRTQLTPATLLFQDYGDKALTPVTREAFLEYPVQAARYAPATLIQYFYARKVKPSAESSRGTAVYQATLHQTVVRLYISRADHRLLKVTALSDDELLGDVLTTYSYQDYATLGRLSYPRTITIDKVNGRLTDQVTITAAELTPQVPALLTAPAGYQLAPAADKPAQVTVTHRGPHLHFLELKHTDDRVLVVEFDSFLLVAEAPLNSRNGELILAEARRIAPAKPIRYFVAGHYHPHYLGGVRPFVQRGATILTTAADELYVQYLAAAPHTLRPDSLQLHPRPLRTEEIQGVKTIAEGGFEMQIHHIGAQSAHTSDYLIYYFPTEKLLFEDDLAWIPQKGEVRKASARQAGLYQAIQDRKLAVDTLVQSWPVQDYGVKSVIPFRELEASVRGK
ncbi:MBL fold metallo-hydrolase [Hymenobacter persicinus]|uniref:MBL fold metallo-hydrolase n=1 Tax=Hymenobacter persicinus TaxID=2025506 RepID=A0A4Q5LEN5_9BACT|nr:hypothetical protein [Hymenobacter persicinus]RYU82854.1 hypothetical protein EWM57_03965 [Hymenobacter persicinus]